MATRPRFPRRPADPTVTPEGQLGNARNEFRVAAFGDSMMWGQGLRRADRYSWLVTQRLAAHHGRAPRLVTDRSRSGAEIAARIDQRLAFVDRFPELFRSAAQRESFLSGDDEEPATRLYGENPATFPTISWQVEAVGDALGRSVDVALVDGGANDIGFDRVLNPEEFPGKFVEEFDGEIRRIAYADTLTLIGQVRHKCPRAVILVFGYFRPLSYASKKSRIKAFFKHEFSDDVAWYLNSALKVVDIDQMIHEARVRSEWAAGRAQHWTRQAVTDANRLDDIRGPGVVFVPAPFTADNAVFAPDPFVFEDFTHTTSDPAQSLRERQIPRRDLLPRLAQLRLLLTVPQSPPSAIKKLTADLLADLPGPTSLIECLAGGVTSGEDKDEAIRLLGGEIARIRRALIASFLHPNTAGARAYADLAVDRYTEFIGRRDRVASARPRTSPRPTRPAAQTSITDPDDAALQRFGLRGAGSLLRDLTHLEVDALALTIVTARGSDERLRPDMYLDVSVDGPAGPETRSHLLNMAYYKAMAGTLVTKYYPEFEPAITNLFTVPLPGDLPLTSITGIAIRMGADPLSLPVGAPGTTWRPRRIQLQLNGVVVLDRTYRGLNTAVTPTGVLELDYPPPKRTGASSSSSAAPVSALV